VKLVAALLATTAIATAAPSAKFATEYQAGVDAFRLGKFDDARAHLEKARTLEPKLPGPHRFLAAVAQAQQRWDDCIASARRALEVNPTSSEIGETRKLHDACRTSAGRLPYTGPDLGDGAAIAVTANVDGATVKISGLTYGGTPLVPRPIHAGSHDVELAKLGYKPAHATVDALPGIVTDVVLELVPAN
jgi:tetratricopeptide (TPR) repeat protein